MLTDSHSHDFRLVHSANLEDHERSSIWNIFESNMRDLCVVLALSRLSFLLNVAEPAYIATLVRPSDGILPQNL